MPFHIDYDGVWISMDTADEMRAMLAHMMKERALAEAAQRAPAPAPSVRRRGRPRGSTKKVAASLGTTIQVVFGVKDQELLRELDAEVQACAPFRTRSALILEYVRAGRSGVVAETLLPTDPVDAKIYTHLTPGEPGDYPG